MIKMFAKSLTLSAIILGVFPTLSASASSAPVIPVDQAQTSTTDDAVTMIYDASRGSLSIDFANLKCRMIELASEKGLWQRNRPEFIGEHSFDIWNPRKVFVIREDALPTLHFGDVLPKGLTFRDLSEDLRVKCPGVKKVQLLILHADISTKPNVQSSTAGLHPRQCGLPALLLAPMQTSTKCHSNGSITSKRVTYSVDNFGVSEFGNIRLAVEGKSFSGRSSSDCMVLSNGAKQGEMSGLTGTGNARFTWEEIDGGSACIFAGISFRVVKGNLLLLDDSFAVNGTPTLIVINSFGRIDAVVDLPVDR